MLSAITAVVVTKKCILLVSTVVTKWYQFETSLSAAETLFMRQKQLYGYKWGDEGRSRSLLEAWSSAGKPALEQASFQQLLLQNLTSSWRRLSLFRKCSAWVHTYFMPCKFLYYLCWLRSGWVVLRCRTWLIFLCIVFPGGFLFVQRNSCSGRFSMLKVFINLAFSHIRGCR